MNLSQVRVGQTVKVVKLHGSGPVRRRIMDMGITKGQEIFVRKVAPLGDPMEVNIRNYELSVRKADCENIEVELLGADATEGEV
jgi:ferrous iron transport protein A